MFDKKIKNEKLFVTFLATYDIESSEYSSQLCKSNVRIAICHKKYKEVIIFYFLFIL